MKNSIKHPAAFSATQFPIILFSALLLSVFLTSASQAQISGSDLKRFQYEFSASIYKQYADAVVYVTGEFSDPKKRELKEYFKIPNQKPNDSIGTGFFITDTGYILTNAHGVHKSVSAVVELRNSVRYNAHVIGFMLEEDLALLKIDLKEPVKAVTFKEDAEIEVGEPITSISHPHGLKYTCAQGIVSAAGRKSHLSDINVTVDSLLQTDMSINPGSSGGPWFNAEGKVVALTTSKKNGSDNIGFGVSAQKILRKLPALFDYPHRSGFVRGFEFSIKDGGVFVDNLDEASAAAKAGLKNGDRILTVNGTPITGIVSYLNLEEKFQAEQNVEMTVKSENEKKEDNPDNGERVVTFTLEKWNAPDVNDALWSKVGLKVRELTEEEFKTCELKSSFAFVITEINTERFDKMNHKIQIGDIIGKIGGVRPENLSELNRLLARLKSGDKIKMTILRAANAEDKTPLISASASHDFQQSENSENNDADSENKSENPDEAKAQKPKSIAKTRIDFTDFKIE